MKEKPMRTTIDLDRETWRDLKVYCALEGVKMATVLRKIIAEFLEQEKRKSRMK